MKQTTGVLRRSHHRTTAVHCGRAFRLRRRLKHRADRCRIPPRNFQGEGQQRVRPRRHRTKQKPFQIDNSSLNQGVMGRKCRAGQWIHGGGIGAHKADPAAGTAFDGSREKRGNAFRPHVGGQGAGTRSEEETLRTRSRDVLGANCRGIAHVHHLRRPHERRQRERLDGSPLRFRMERGIRVGGRVGADPKSPKVHRRAVRGMQARCPAPFDRLVAGPHCRIRSNGPGDVDESHIGYACSRSGRSGVRTGESCCGRRSPEKEGDGGTGS